MQENENAYEKEYTGYDDVGLEVYAKPPAEVEDHEPVKSWEELVSAWMTVRELGDASNWTLGDIANEVERSFGKSKGPDGRRPIDIWSSAVGEKPDTVRQYAWVSKTFPNRSDRATGLSWTHYRTVAKTGDMAMAWINEAVRNDWTAAQLAEEVKNVQDAASVTEGRPCDACGEHLPDEGSIHIRVNGKKLAAICSWTCVVAFALPLAKGEEKVSADVLDQVDGGSDVQKAA